MLVRSSVEARFGGREGGEGQERVASLPRGLKGESASARSGLLRRLSASRVFSLGQRAGALRSAQARSGRPFRLDVRQRVIVKALVFRYAGAGAMRAAALLKHVSYLGRSGAGLEGARPEFFDKSNEGLDAREVTRGWADDRHHFRFIISPEHGDRISDLRGYVREVMSRAAADLGEPRLNWVATCHFDTGQPHAHVLVRGKREDGRDLVIPRQYVGYGFRGRAQEVAQELLGDLSRVDAERRIWRETQADRFTGFDRRLLQVADADRMVPDASGDRHSWAALTRGRLLHLEKLGLAVREGRFYRLDAELEGKLRALQVRRDVIRTLNEQRLRGANAVRELEPGRVSGQVVRSGFHDEMGASPFVVVRDRQGVEHYARLAAGAALPTVGGSAALQSDAKGARVLQQGRGIGALGL